MLSPDQLSHFAEQGYLVVEDVIDAETVLGPIVSEYDRIMDELRTGWMAEGKLESPAIAATFEDKVISAYRSGLEYFQPMDISLPGGTIEEDTPFHAGPAVFRLITDDNLLDVIESIIGPEITSNPIQHVRIKPPAADLRGDEIRAHITATDWHQDRAVTLAEADGTRMVTAWVAVTDATVDNGCLRVIPGSHLGEMIQHCPSPQVGIPTKFLDEEAARPLPIGAGGVVLFHPLTIHGSLSNTTPNIRWSFDLRYNVTGDPTGRPMFPEFVARSRAQPDSAMRDPDRWQAMWEVARARLAANPHVPIHRWSPDAAHCA
ncbi:MAG: phytanoyl-CoA dioxygenase family protein [Hyphomicrobiales bacterium]|nr:phytanoyl-CoA dioxygenase family protein [Hyphomicrobiales bacterium]